MNLHTQRLSLRGPCGDIEALRDDPSGPAKGVAVISHPHPLFGGTMDNKVVQTLARAFVQSGWSAVRYNFRGVGSSAGHYDEGRGEVADLLAVVNQQAGTGALALAGFSFGAFVTAQAAAQLAQQRPIEQLVLVGTAASRFQVPEVPQTLHDCTLVVHGEHDDTVPLSAVMDWARPQTLPVLVVPGGGHFFHGQLPLLKSRVMRHLGI
jgi:hypothetical protein